MEKSAKVEKALNRLACSNGHPVMMMMIFFFFGYTPNPWKGAP
jgi:hypothetical protein